MLWKGLVAGTVGVAAMTAGEKVEQRLTSRPDAYVRLGRSVAGRVGKFAVIRLTTDQILETGTGVGLAAEVAAGRARRGPGPQAV